MLPAEARREEAHRALVERARSGDSDAFAELVRMHRAQALGWANAIARDAYLAEDIVQDALIRAFLHLGTLLDTSRFLPWLHRIVRNQANMRLRRGGPYAKEQPFSGFGRNGSRSGAWNRGGGGMSDKAGAGAYGSADAGARSGADHGGADSVDWGDLDRVLFHLSRSVADIARQQGDPAGALLRQETLQGIRDLLRCLSKRERSMFEAHFFEELPPAEIAALFGTTTANVYNVLSRSRAKVQKERIRASLFVFVQRRASLGLPSRRVLQPPPDF
nr:sigma-70 family RNA polymerase sigma factor [Paenibacillus sp. VKM B-2647]